MRAPLLLGLLALASCAGAHKGENATFRVFYPDMPATGFKAKVGKKFYVKPVGQCVYENGKDARWAMTGAKVADGTLPPNFTIEDGAISGTPIEAGTWTVRVKFSGVTCAGSSHEPQTVDVTITAVKGG
jgi:hypothetical protein